MSIAKYEGEVEQINIEEATVEEFSCGTYASFFLTYNHLTCSEKRPEPEVYNHTREILLYYSSYYEPLLSSSTIDSWWAEYELTFALSNGATTSHIVRWDAEPNSSNKITKTEIRAAIASTQYFNLVQADGTEELWAVKLIKDDEAVSSECELLGLNVKSTLPNYIEFEDPAYTLNESSSELYFNIGSRYNFPMSIDLEYEVSSYASVEPSTLYFENEVSEQVITIVAQDGVTTKEFVARLIVPQESVAPTINSISFGELESGVSIVGGVKIDAEKHTISVGVEATDAHFPLQIPILAVDVADGGVFEMPTSGAITLASAQSTAIAWVSSEDGAARQMWNFEILYYQQLTGGDMNSWEWDASPVTSSLPWSTPNMSGIASVKNTNPVEGRSGVEGDYAAEMKTGTSWGQLASGSIFTGWFDKNNSTAYGLSDPVRLTYFGTPFSPDAAIKGITADISYAQAANAVDWGSITVILIAEDPTASFEFHGNKPNDSDDPTAGSAPHPNNTAVEVVSNKMIFGNGSAATTSYGDVIDMNVESGEWVELFIPISTDKPFTHISIAAASSAYGDYFIGQVGSVMRIDNVKIIYE
ncbi:MAG: PCMD domain-containing protein [Rikenellaceae bacterium]